MIDNLSRLWADANAPRRLGFLFGVLLIGVILAYAASVLLRTDYQTLFADLDPHDTATLAAELDRMKVPYRLGADETSIKVDAAQVLPTRMKLLGKAPALRGGVGFEIFNNSDFGMTEFAQKVNYQRALQGELTRTIGSLDEVRSARVHLVLPESGLFRKSTVQPKAAITLAMKPGRRIQADQVNGIQRLVAAAVPEIDAAQVTIVDERGVMLTRPADALGEAGTQARFSAKGEIEDHLVRKVVAVLDKNFGPGRAIVTVDVTLNHDQVKVTREDVLPAGGRSAEASGALRLKRTTTVPDATLSAAPEAGKPPGPVSTGGSSAFEVEYQNGRRVEQVVSQPGGIRRLSVGVMLPHGVARSRVEELRQVIAMSVGMNAARGDEIAIGTLDDVTPVAAAAPVPATADAAAAGPAPAQDAAAAAVRKDWQPGLPLALGAVLLALLMLVGYAVARRSRPQPQPQPLSADARERLLGEVRDWLAAEPKLRTEEPRL